MQKGWVKKRSSLQHKMLPQTFPELKQHRMHSDSKTHKVFPKLLLLELDGMTAVISQPMELQKKKLEHNGEIRTCTSRHCFEGTSGLVTIKYFMFCSFWFPHTPLPRHCCGLTLLTQNQNTKRYNTKCYLSSTFFSVLYSDKLKQSKKHKTQT